MKNKIRLIINGAFGKMGSLAINTLNACDDFEVIGGLGRNDDLKKNLILKRPDLVLDLTRADCVFTHAQIFLETQTKFVIGTSGLDPKQIDFLKQNCQTLRLGGSIIPNFSIGSVLSTYFAKLAAPWFDAVEIIEMHHAQKTDSPSGTALHTAQSIAETKSSWPKMNPLLQAGREYRHQQIPIHAIRMPGLLAVQQTILGQPGETIELKHQIIDRQAYMPGLKLACREAIHLQELKVGLEHWLFQPQKMMEPI